MTPTNPVYMELVEFIAGTAPAAVAKFHPSAAAQNRVSSLLARNSEGELNVEERAELDHFIELEHILRMARAKARQILSQAP